MTIMVSAQNLTDAAAQQYNTSVFCYGVSGGDGDGGGCTIGFSHELMTTPEAYALAPNYSTISNNNYNNSYLIVQGSSDILSLGAAGGTAIHIIGSNHRHHHHPDYRHNHNSSIIMAEAEVDAETTIEHEYSSKTGNSGNCKEDVSSSSNKLQATPPRDQEEEEEDDDDEEGGGGRWLQLGIGGGDNPDHQKDERDDDGSNTTGVLMLDLNLGGACGSSFEQKAVTGMLADEEEEEESAAAGISHGIGVTSTDWGGAALLPPHIINMQQQQQQQQEGWGFLTALHHHNPIPTSRTPFLLPARVVGPEPSSSSWPSSSALFLSRPPASPFFFAPPQHAHTFSINTDIRIIDPPPRTHHSGIWFMLLASHPQAKEPFLPQVPKRFLRIKDGRMTVRVVTKYVANKLGLDSESEVEIRCRGQEVEGNMRLQEVRDRIWRAREAAVTLAPHSSAADHIMILHYGRR